MIRKGILTALACVSLSCAAFAQAWPAKPITMILPSAPGSGLDVSVRLYTDRLAKALNQPIIPRNIVGASGAIGAQTAAKAAPDGYTFFIGSAGILIVNKYTMKTPGYDGEKDFVPVALLNRAPFLLLMNPSLPIKTMAELTAYVRANPNKLLLGFESATVRGVSAYFKSALNYPIDLVAYTSAAQSMQDIMGGSVHLHIQGSAVGLAYAQDGRLRVLALLSGERLPQLPNVPTMEEYWPGFGAFDAWVAVMAPRGTPADIVKRMSAEVHAVGSTPELTAMFGKLGFFEEKDRSPERTAAYIRAQSEQFAKMAKAAHFTPE